MRRRAFTLIEVLIVVAIIALLLALLLPSLSYARGQARRTACLSNMRQMVFAAHVYEQTNRGRYPSARFGTPIVVPPTITIVEWDYKTVRNWSTGKTMVRPGLLWAGKADLKVQQCPAFQGASTGINDPYTGYNYNTSFIGHIPGESSEDPSNPPITVSEIRRPTKCALFGDGQWAQGANKYMRAPWSNPGDAAFSARSAGTQGFRHLRMTNVAYCDGHAAPWPWAKRYTNTYPSEACRIAENTGFLSSDNRAYSPD